MNRSALFERGRQLVHLNRIKEAMEVYRKILAGDPQDVWAHTMLAVCFSTSGQHEEALREACLAVQLDPDNAWAFQAKAIGELGNNLCEEALKSIQKAITLDPESSCFYVEQARILWVLSRISEAEEACYTALRIDPEETDALNILTDLAIDKKHRDAGMKTSREALRLAPVDSQSHASLGFSLAHTNRIADAAVAFREALRLNPENQRAHRGLKFVMKVQHPVGNMLHVYRQWMIRFGFTIQFYLLVLCPVLLVSGILAPFFLPDPTASFLSYGMSGAIVVIVIFCVITWLLFWMATPLSDAVIFFMPSKRHVLNVREKRYVMIFLSLVVLGIGFCVLGNMVSMPRFAFLGAGLLFLVQPISFISNTEPGRGMATYSLIIGLLTVAAVMSGKENFLAWAAILWIFFNLIDWKVEFDEARGCSSQE